MAVNRVTTYDECCRIREGVALPCLYKLPFMWTAVRIFRIGLPQKVCLGEREALGLMWFVRNIKKRYLQALWLGLQWVILSRYIRSWGGYKLLIDSNLPPKDNLWKLFWPSKFWCYNLHKQHRNLLGKNYIYYDTMKLPQDCKRWLLTLIVPKRFPFNVALIAGTGLHITSSPFKTMDTSRLSALNDWLLGR